MKQQQLAAMLLAYVLIFFLHLSASTCHATSRNQHLLFAGRAADDAGAALLPAAIHHHHRHTAKAEAARTAHALYDDVQVLPDYNDVRRHYQPKVMMARWGGGAPPRPPSTSRSVELAGVGGSPPPPPPSLSAVETTIGVEGAPPPPPRGKQDTSAAMEPSPSPMPSSSSPHGEGASSSAGDDAASATEQETSASASGDVDVDADYDGPMTHPPSHN